jgi:large subunit ribosomal protein L10
MAKTRKQKVKLLDEYRKLLKESTGVFVTKPSKLTPNEVNEFKKDLYDINSKFHVVKNTLFKIALKENNLPEIEELNNEEHAVLFSKDDVASSAKLLKKFIDATTDKKKDIVKLSIVKGIVEGQLLDKDQVVEIADMPNKETSIAMILGILDNAIAGVLNVLEDPLRGYVSILDQAFKE